MQLSKIKYCFFDENNVQYVKMFTCNVKMTIVFSLTSQSNLPLSGRKLSTLPYTFMKYKFYFGKLRFWGSDCRFGYEISPVKWLKIYLKLTCVESDFIFVLSSL